MDNIEEKYESNVFTNLDKENRNKILSFLQKEKCNCIEELLYDYLDLFLIPYENFIRRYAFLNQKYNGLFLSKASEDMNLFEEFYTMNL